jgi:NodT family efflux transporter outer membrane factor (OMF) lipoprotein
MNIKAAPTQPMRRATHRPAMLARTHAWPARLGLCAVLTGCATPRMAPNIEIPQRFAVIPASAHSEEALSTRWWERFGDPILNGLMNEAAAANRDVRAALARAELAQEGVREATADLLPSIDAVGTRTKQTTSYSAPIRQELPDIHASQAGLQTSWEIDLFGRARAARRAARADSLAAADAHRGALLLALSDTAQHYFILRGAQAQRQIIADLVNTEHETLRLTQLRRARGAASDFDLDRARGELSDTEALLPRFDSLITTSRNHIAVLIGRPPGQWRDPLTDTPSPITVPAIPVSQPAQLLRRRPDLMAADATLAAAGFRQDEARALQFPQLVVSALVGSQWTDVNAVDIGRARFTNAAGALALPLFAGGRIRAGIAAADASQREAVARYEQTLLRALEDVEGSTTSYVNDARRGASLQSAIDSRSAALSKAQSLYRAGELDLLQVLDVERGLLSSRLDGAASDTALLTDVVQTYKALGGGWETFDSTAQATPSGSPHARFTR